MEKFIENLHKRYATKEFDLSKKVSKEDLENIIEAFRLTPSSFGLQPWKLFVVENKEIKQKIMENSWNQKQVWENSYLLVFAKKSEINTDLVEKYISKTAEVNWIEKSNLDWYKQMILSFVENTSKEELDTWAREQVFLALGNVMAYLSEKNIDSCAIWGFSKDAVNEILNLKEKGFESVVLLPIGYRSENDKYASRKKSRFEVWEISEII